MKKMMTNMKTLVALLMAGAAVTSCSSDNEMDSLKAPAGKTYTMTVQATKGGDATTRALADGGDGTLTATWATTENVYVKKGSDWATGSLTPQTAGTSTTLKGTLSGVTIAANDVLTLQFPKSGDITYAGQKGTLADIAENFDWATATVTATVSDNKVTASAASFVHQQAIVKFTLEDKANTSTKLNATALTINDGTSDIVTLTSIPDATYTTNGDGVLYVALPAISSKPITLTATVGSDTYTLTTSSAKSFANGSYYRVTAQMTKQASVPEGAISGVFSVSATKKVYFSKGNLRYASGTWSFFDNQYDYYTTHDGTNWDKFGWSTSATTYGMNTSKSDNDYSGDFADWGSNSALQTALGTGWFTLSIDEWKYVFGTNDGDKRSGATVGGTSNARYTEATINTNSTGVNGVILFPDGATFAASEASWGTINGSSDWGTKCTTAQWTALEAKGCVFLPAAGYRQGASVSLGGSNGDYWSSTAYGTGNAGYVYCVDFSSGDVDPEYNDTRSYGYSVRLVKDVAASAPAVPTGALNGEFSVSATKQVYFSKGNLYYDANATTKWYFAANQWDYIGTATGYPMDLFTWGNISNPTYDGTNNVGGYDNLSGDTDWGSRMGTGWRTLTGGSGGEWEYLFNTRSASTVNGKENARYAKARVNNVGGVILFPDTYTHPDGVTAPTGINVAGITGWNNNSYNTTDWEKMESAGCVFLPAAGYRSGTTMYGVGSEGYYWSSTYQLSSGAYRVYFVSDDVTLAGSSARAYGSSVRLVYDVQ